MATLSSRAASGVDAPDMRFRIASGTETRSSFHELGVAQAHQRPDPAIRGCGTAQCSAGNSPAAIDQTTGWVTAYSAPACTLNSKRRISSSKFVAPGFAPRRSRIRCPRQSDCRQYPARVEVVHNVHQADGVHVKHRRSIGIIPHLRRIARNADQIMNPGGRGSQQVGLDSQHIPVAAGVVQNGLNPTSRCINNASA